MIVPNLDHNMTGLQLVDGNNFLLARFRQPADALGIRGVINDVTSCSTPPIFVFDGFNNNKRRRDLYPAYKVREPKTTGGNENLYPSIELVKSLLLFTDAIMVECPTWEADDVLATLAHDATSRGMTTRIITTDRDLSQLMTDPLISVTNVLEGVAVQYVRLYKTLVGDQSDKIKGIPKFGPVSFDNIKKDKMISMLEGGVWVRDDYGMRSVHQQWCEDNFAELLVMWKITGLMSVPSDVISAGTKVGTPNPAVINQILQEFML